MRGFIVGQVSAICIWGLLAVAAMRENIMLTKLRPTYMLTTLADKKREREREREKERGNSSALRALLVVPSD